MPLFGTFSVYQRHEKHIFISLQFNKPILSPTDLFGDPLRPIDLELGTMDFAGYQMLTDPNGTMIADPTIEDSFRRDLN